ncbi:MAG: sulfur globule protein precursor, partial [Bradyrhizobium sp.]|nr:sulfur globule protein precursor [Bradyrhizobium sp.]
FYGPRVFVGGPVYSYGYGGCYVRRVVPTPWGPRWRWINRCY